MNRIAYFKIQEPNPNGGGGYHRTYQVEHELITAFGKENYENPILTGSTSRSVFGLSDIKESIMRRISYTTKIWKLGFQPQELFEHILSTDRSGLILFRKIPKGSYENYLRTNPKPSICLVDSAKFLPIIRINKLNGIPTLFCPQNLDSFDLSAHLIGKDLGRKRCGISLIYELEAFTQCTIPLVISKLEVAILDGLGVNSIFYPYIPVGEIKERLLAIRSERQDNGINPNLFLMVASVNHTTTYESYKWFFRNALGSKLPDNVKIIVGGRNSDALGQEFPPIPGVKFLGQLDQEVLNDYLRQACAILIPQMSGFGAVTRIPEMACAGIPMVVSEHATNAINIPPGVHVVQNDWKQWVDRIRFLQINPPSLPLSGYEEWENKQPRPLIDIIQSHLESR